MPADFVPPQGWQPDPTWPPAPQGWNFWIEDSPVTQAPSAAVPGPGTTAGPQSPVGATSSHGTPTSAPPPAGAYGAPGDYAVVGSDGVASSSYAQLKGHYDNAKRSVIYGLIALVIGVGITGYSLMNGGGGVITYGLIIVGLIVLIRGALGMRKSKAGMNALQANQPGGTMHGMP